VVPFYYDIVWQRRGDDLLRVMLVMPEIERELERLADPRIAQHSQRFFKTGKGEYGEGDIFLGIRVPRLHELVRQNRECSIDDAVRLLQSKYHEARLLALLLLVAKFQKGGDVLRGQIFKIYLHNTRQINNWDLVDSSAHKIVGKYLLNREREPLYKLSRSKNLWQRRIAIIATFTFIAEDDFADALKIAEQHLADPEDLIHKAVGWMLREIGKRDQAVEERFLKTRYHQMPRTMLRYAIEKFPENLRKQYLSGVI
jgi:3-methyladenine DNA glycosylase AlkD